MRCLVSIVLLITVSCAPTDCPDDSHQGGSTTPASETTPPDPSQPTEGLTVEVELDPEHPLTATVRWSGPEAGAGDLQVQCGDAIDLSFHDPEHRQSHGVFVIGLISGSACEAIATIAGLEGTASWTVGDLPSNLPQLEVPRSDPGAMAPGMTLINLIGMGSGLPMVVAVVDEQGRYRWFDDQVTDGSGLDNVTRMVPEGILVGGQMGEFPPTLVGWRGDKLWQGVGIEMHHEIAIDDDGDYLVLAKGDPAACPDGVSSDVVEEIDPATGQTVWSWRICEHYQPLDAWEDWDHLNAIEPLGPDAMLVSSRHQNAVFKVDRHSGEVLWKLGQDGDFALSEADTFYNNHGPEMQPDGRVLLFDNGHDGRPHSRLLELELDEVARTAEVVWSFRPDPDIYAWAWGDADRLANGNTLGTFGHVLEGERARVFEVNADSEVVWELSYPDGWGSYRADRVELPEGFVLDAADGLVF